MATALDVANYFLNRVDRESGDLITQLKLYKLVYYAQAWSLVFRRKPMFNGEIQAWEHGPVPADLYPVFQEYGRDSIPEPSCFDAKRIFVDEELQILELVWNLYGELSASKLRLLTHDEDPWCQARKGLPDDAPSQEPISEEEIRSYYQDFGSIIENKPVVDLKALSQNKDDVYGNLFLKDGESVRVGLSKIDQYRQVYGDQIEERFLNDECTSLISN